MFKIGNASFLKHAKDGGPLSTVWGFWLIEWKKCFSVAFLCFEKGSREAYHTHSFNAFTWFLKGEVNEFHRDGSVLNWKPSWKPKWTPRNCFHKVYAKERTFVFTIRGPWVDKWKEYIPGENKEVTLTNGRKIVEERVCG